MLKWILGFLLGISSIFWLTETFSFLGWVLTIALLLVLIAISGRIYDKSWLFHGTQICIGACLGLLWLNIHCELRLANRVTQPVPESHIIKAKLVSMPQVYNDLLQFRVKIQSSDYSFLRGKKLKLSWYQFSQELSDTSEYPKLGEIWQFQVKVKPQVSALNLAGYDVEKQSFINGIAGKGTVKAFSAERLVKTSKYSIDYLRQTLFDKLTPLENAGVFQALLIGEKSNISSEQRLKIQALGISHLLAISGLHISIIAGLFFWLTTKAVSFVNRFGLVVSPLLTAALVSLLAALFYSALAGFSVATVRALIMWATFVMALVFSSQQFLLRSMAIALLVILILDPISVLSYGFWLTFIAIGIIGAVFMGRVVSDGSSRSKLWLAVKTQWAISLGMMLAIVTMFQKVSFIAFFINIILIPVFSILILPLIFFATLILLAFESYFMLQIIDAGFSHFFSWISLTNLKSTGMFLQTYLDWDSLLLLALGFILYLLPIGRLRYLPISLCLLLVGFLSIFPKQDDDFKLVVFDVGHGLANLVYSSKYAVLYDTGFANEGFSYAETTIIPTLRKLGITKLDLLVVSHNDLDHSGGFNAINTAFDISKIIDSEACDATSTIELGDLNLSFYSPFN